MELVDTKHVFDEMNAIKCCRNDLKRNLNELNKVINEYKIISSIPVFKKSNDKVISQSIERCRRLESYIDVLMDLVDYKRGKELTREQINEIREVLSKEETFQELRGDMAISLIEIVIKDESKNASVKIKKNNHTI